MANIIGEWLTLCPHDGEGCLEIAPLDDGGRAIRNSNDPDVVVISNAAEWSAVVTAILGGVIS